MVGDRGLVRPVVGLEWVIGKGAHEDHDTRARGVEVPTLATGGDWSPLPLGMARVCRDRGFFLYVVYLFFIYSSYIRVLLVLSSYFFILSVGVWVLCILVILFLISVYRVYGDFGMGREVCFLLGR